MHAEIQRIADSLGRSLHRPIGVDDLKIRMLAYNSVGEAENDEARRFAILNRAASQEIRDWVASHRPLEATGAYKISANARIGLANARWGAVARSEGRAVAYLWVLTGPGESLDDDEQAQLLRAAEAVGDVIGRQHLVDELRTLREREGLGDLFGLDDRARTLAAERVADAGLFPPDAAATALVIRVHLDGSTTATARERQLLEDTVERFRLLLPSGRMLAIVRPGHAAVVVARGAHNPSRFQRSVELAEALQAQFAVGAAPEDAVWVGIGRRVPMLVEIGRSYREALQSAEVTSSIQGLGSPVHFNRLGVYRRLAQLVGEQEDASRIHPGIQALLDREAEGDDLAATLETYLDNAGDAARSAADLLLHRASLYGRLRRIEQIAVLDLRNGQDRLVAHLELKLARLERRLRQVST